jgi:hypothetical protein
LDFDAFAAAEFRMQGLLSPSTVLVQLSKLFRCALSVMLAIMIAVSVALLARSDRTFLFLTVLKSNAIHKPTRKSVALERSDERSECT